jgi:hypothetical protein
MPSYGSNDGYGRQKLGDRPSTKLTEIGRAQADSSQMAKLLAEADIEREPEHAALPAAPPVDLSAPPQTQWFQAAKAGDVASLERLLAANQQLLHSTARGIGHSATHWAATSAHLAAVQWLLDAGAAVDARNAGESTPLHTAAGGGHLAVVEELCRRGADRSAADDEGRTPMDNAVLRGRDEVVRFLAASAS